MAQYELVRRFYDGAVIHPVGSRLEFEPGKQPKGATLISGAPVVPEAPEAPNDPDQLEIGLDAPLPEVKPGDTLSSLAKKGK